jgi:uncharacterized protein (TIGR02271 family)
MAQDTSGKLADEAVLPVIQEEVGVGQQQVQTGAVRVRKASRDEQVEVPAEVVAERVTTERVPINRVVQLRPEIRHEGDTVVVPVVEERLVVHTELVLVEEVRITTHREVRDGTQVVSLRREQAIVERQDPATGRWKPEG